LEPERYGLTFTVPEGVGMMFSVEWERVVIISIVDDLVSAPEDEDEEASGGVSAA
jgi:hypothetical protein